MLSAIPPNALPRKYIKKIRKICLGISSDIHIVVSTGTISSMIPEIDSKIHHVFFSANQRELLQRFLNKLLYKSLHIFFQVFSK